MAELDRQKGAENISALLNIETLRGRLAAGVSAQREPFLTLYTPLQSPALRQPLPTVLPSQQELRATVNEKLHAIFDLLLKDVLATRDRLIALNPGRRTMIERRLEFIARKIARKRGERFNRSLSLTDILRETFREGQPAATVAQAAWDGFAAEVALYHMLELFFLKSLDFHGWRTFEPGDAGRMYAAARDFLNQRAADFTADKHCWNFVRTNLYSWHVPTQRTQQEIEKLLAETTLSWSDQDLIHWASCSASHARLSHLDFAAESKVAEMLLSFMERELAMPLISNFQGNPVCKKVFVPALELGGVTLTILDRMLRHSNGSLLTSGDSMKNQSLMIQRALWACESECLEIFWTEVMSLLKTLRWTSIDKVLASARIAPREDAYQLFRLPHVIHAVQTLGLELHNLDQLPLGGPEISRLQHGSAGQIQQLETFDIAVVTDHPDRAKSGKWMSALVSQLPYWRNLVASGTNLNWGELHLSLALSKLREGGVCAYFSHRVLPEGGDGDKLRRMLLGIGVFEYFIELGEEEFAPYRYMYVFRRTESKTARDGHHPRFGKPGALEEASATQAEIAERGWDHLFVRGAAPLVRHLNHKFPKLFQVATVQKSYEGAPHDLSLVRTTSQTQVQALVANPSGTALSFTPAQGLGSPTAAARYRDSTLVFPHNPTDLPWIECLLNSAPAQFWIRQSREHKPDSKVPTDLRSVPVVDLTRAPAGAVHEAMEWVGSARPDEAALMAWACAPGDTSTLGERQAKYVALAKRYCALEQLLERYRPMFRDTGAEDDLPELRPEAVTRFYPERLLCHLSQSPEVRIQYSGRERTSLIPENWSLAEAHSVVQPRGAYLVVATRQGPSIQILVPLAVRGYLMSQLEALRDRTWGEALTMMRIPRDVALFAAQTGEITRVVQQSSQDLRVYRRVLGELALALFEISPDVRQFL